MRRVTPIEGLRAWLALWVLTGHVMGFSGYDDDGTWNGLPKLLREGNLAVDVFIIVSGFVIFLLLDQRKENYPQFICRRFFRLYPLYLPLFLLAIPLSLLRHWTVQHGQAWLSAGEITFENNLFNSAWQNWRLNIPAHLAMLHGIIPDAGSGGFFARATWLGPAWSISLEWQFYLVAPALFWLATSAKSSHRLVLGGLCVGLLYLGYHYPWGDGFLPFHLEFFFVGAASYFLYKRQQKRGAAADAPGPFLPAIVFAWLLYLLSGKLREVIPLGLWIMFFALWWEPPGRPESRLLGLFTHPVAQFLGKISYSIYLSHELVMVVAQAALLKWLPQLGQVAHFWVLLGLTASATIAISTLLHRLVEVPGMKFGHALAERLGVNAALKPLPPAPTNAQNA
jgi:peptidoglycan/LPS O-acetylase OafA/YrhL